MRLPGYAPPRRKKRGKPRAGRVRGRKMAELRAACFDRDRGICQACFLPVDPNDWDMAHVRGKRMWGDGLDNVRTKHPHCHRVLEHNPKAVPAK